MSATPSPQPDPAAPDRVYVWDRFIRIFHWSLLATVTICFLTEDEVMFLHIWAGYTAGVLIMARIVWGVVGPRHARFTDFIYSAARVKEHLLQMAKLRAPRYLGHSPAGGAMVMALMLVLGATVASGISADTRVTITGRAGPIGAVHEVLANLAMILIFVHIGGVIVTSLAQRENLVRAMITGWKRR